MLFADRLEAGRGLAERLAGYRGEDCVVLGIPRGGVPIGYVIARALGCPLDVVVPRKLPIPWSPEAGFGAVMPDGTRVLNEPMLGPLGLSPEQVEMVTARVVTEVQRRMRVYRGDRPLPRLEGRVVIITDDGLATGYTMLAAALATRKQSPRELLAAVPVSPRGTAREVSKVVDKLVVLHVSEAMPFAVAAFYHAFTEMSDDEVIHYLRLAEGEGEQRAA